MSWNTQLTALNQILAELYPIQNQSLRVVKMAQIPSQHIVFGGSAMDNWFNILQEALRRNKVSAITQIAYNEYPEREELKELFTKSTPETLFQPVEKTHFENLKSLVVQGKLEKVIEELRKVTSESSNDLQNTILLQSANITRLESDRRKNIITDADYNIRLNRINFTLLELIDEIPSEKQLVMSRAMLSGGSASLSTPDMKELEKIIGREELFEINWFRKALQASKSVCKIILPNGSSGSGFVLKGHYLLTNNHVLETKADVDSAKIIFNYQIDAAGNMAPTKEFKLDSSIFFHSEPDELDYSLMKIFDPDSSLDMWGNLTLETFEESNIGDKVNIIQHPEGNTMKIALPDKIISKWKQYLFYLADTKPGSSGAPVFNQNWNVIALHHAGRNEEDAEGGLQINEAGEVQPTNRGILIKEIINDLNVKGLII